MRKPVITLLTDFGYRDHYVAAMKAVMLSITPDAVIVDISHGIPKQDVRAGAYVLKCAYKYFPPGTVHVAVVDPGVGTPRSAVVVKTKRYLFVGPDNGVLALAAIEDGIIEVREIRNRSLFREQVSSTFHGRDIFAPVAAHLARGLPLEEVGPVVSGIVTPEFARPRVEPGYLECEVLYVDDFGNVVLNATKDDVLKAGLRYGARCRVTIGKDGATVDLPFLEAYGYAKGGEALLLINSEDQLELAVNKGSAAQRFGIAPGDKVTVKLLEIPE